MIEHYFSQSMFYQNQTKEEIKFTHKLLAFQLSTLHQSLKLTVMTLMFTFGHNNSMHKVL